VECTALMTARNKRFSGLLSGNAGPDRIGRGSQLDRQTGRLISEHLFRYHCLA
jgi:hypothetical protein